MNPDILDLLRDIREEVTDGAMTTEELAKGVGVSVKTMRARIKVLRDEGKINLVRIPRVGINGVSQPIPAWVVVGESE